MVGSFGRLSRRRRRGLALVTLAAAAIVAVIAAAFAAGGQFRVVSFEAEAMTGAFKAPSTGQVAPASGAFQIRRDRYASGGTFVQIRQSVVELRMAFAVTASAERLVVRARGEQCEGPAKLAVSIDGQPLQSVEVGASWDDYAFPVSVAIGSHQVAVSMQDDFTAPGCDRNLRVDEVTFFS